ncbi:MAG: S8 family serine peptidase [Anaerolinea sp.]|nr:S8 family serine peptidase [Anaerolinea sp.]
MVRKSIKFLLLLIGATLFAATAAAQPSQTSENATAVDAGSSRVYNEAAGETESAVYIVQLADAPLATYTGGIAGLEATSPLTTGARKLDSRSPASLAYEQYLAGVQDRFAADMNALLGRSVDVSFYYRHAYNGLAVFLSPAEAARVAEMDGVLLLYREREEEILTDAGPDFIGAPELWGGSYTDRQYAATLDGSQEVPPNASTASGTGTFAYNLLTKQLTWNIAHDVAAPTAAHIHSGAVGVNGPIQVPLDHTVNPMVGSATLTDAQQGMLVNQLLYVNIHTAAFPGGEIRGQIVPTGSMGEGIIIGVIDTGINSSHPSFAAVGGDGYIHTNPYGAGNYVGYCATNPGFCNDKLIGAWALHTSSTNPEDTNGHGSHTAGTAGGNFLQDPVLYAPTATYTFTAVSGVAPHANIIAYQVCFPSCPTSSTTAAVNQAVVDGVDVTNYSISGGTNPYVETTAVAFRNAVAAGVFPANSAGNSGPGAGTVGHQGPWIMTVGAGTHDRAILNSVVDLTSSSGPLPDILGQSPTVGYGPAPLVYAGDPPYNNPLCNPFPAGTFTGQIVVCDRGAIGRVAKGQNVLDAGGGGMILLNDAPSAASLNDDTHVLPATHISYADGVILKAWLATGTGHMGRITGGAVDYNSMYGDNMASFSSRGPAGSTVPGLANLIKPDVSAPGLNILAPYFAGFTTPPSFNIISGTSMSSPHAAGAAALIRALNPTWTPAEVKSALMMTGITAVDKEDGVTPGDPFDFGGGRIDLTTASYVGFVLDITDAEYVAADPAIGGDPRLLNLPSMADNNCAGSCSWTRTLRSTLGTAQEYNAAVTGPAGFSGTVTPANFTIPAGGTQVITIAVEIASGTLNAWTFANVSIQPVTRAMTDVTAAHMPIAVIPTDFIEQPGISLAKTVGTSSATCAVTDAITVPAGTAVTYCYTVANIGNVTLNLHDLDDSELGSILNGFPFALDPGASVFITQTVTLTETTVNFATWTAYNAGPIDVVTATDTATVTIGIPDPPNIFVDPLAVSSDQNPDTQTQHVVTINNTGGSDLIWQIFEEPATRPAARPLFPATPVGFNSEAAVAAEIAGLEIGAPLAVIQPSLEARALAKRALLTTGILLAPDSTNDRIMALDPITGDVIDPDFVPQNAVVGTGIHAILSASGDSILLSDQIGDVVHEFDLDGAYLGVFAPAGGANTAIMDNIRGISLDASGNLLVTVGGGANVDAVVMFDTAGNHLGNFIANGAGGLDNPFDVYGRSSDWLVGGIDSDAIHRYDPTGAYIANLTPVNTFPEQIAEAGNGNVLVANFSPSTEEGVLEYTAAGAFVGRYDPAGLGGYRGVYELPGGTILTTTGTGVHEIDRSGNLVQSKITGISGRFIEYVVIQTGCNDLADIPWASVTPDSGTTATGAATNVTVTLDSTGLTPGDYSGNLCFFSNDPDAGPGNETDLVIVPLSLTVLQTQFATIELTKTVGTEAAVCATTSEITVDSGDVVYYCYEVSNTGDVPLPLHDLVDDQLGTIFTGFAYNLQPGESVNTVAAGLTISQTIYLTTTNTAVWTAYDGVSFTATASDSATVNVNVAQIGVAPSSLSSTQAPNTVHTETLTISNNGSASLAWSIVEAGTVFAPHSPAVVLYDNGPLVTHPGGGAGGADDSRLQNSTLLMTTLGFGNQFAVGNRMADEFVVDDSGWILDTVTFFAYQTGSTTASTITGVYVQIWDGPPNDPGSSVVFGDLTTNRMVSTGWSNIYRTSETSIGNTTRPIMANVVDLGGLFLPAGTYWFDWTTDGTLTSGPWAPPITVVGQTTTGNALQFTGTWGAANDGGSLTQQGMPFVIEGSLASACGDPEDIAWLSVSPDSGSTAVGSSSDVTVTFDSAGLMGGTYSATLCVHSNDPFQPLVEAPVTLTVESVYGVELTAAQTELSGATGTTVTYTLTLTNTGTNTDTFDLAATGVWTTTLSESSVTLASGSSTQVAVTVAIPADAADGEMDAAEVTAASQTDPAATADVTLTTTAVVVSMYGVELTAAQTGLSGAAGTTVTYTLTLTNTGTNTDTFNLTATGAWTTTLSESSVTLAAGGSTTLVVTVIVPADAEDGDEDAAVVTAASQTAPMVTDSVTLTTTAVAAEPPMSYIYLPFIIKP